MNDIVYISGGCPEDDLQQLRSEPIIRDFAAVKPDIYALIKATNPTLLLFINLARKICGVEE
jgi:hypothetical protein